MDVSEQSLKLHESNRGKLSVQPKIKINGYDYLSLVYTPGVAAACKAIKKNPEDVYKYTIKPNTVAVVTNGTAVLGLGDIGVSASLPVMEGKCVLFKQFADIDAFPICVDSKDPLEFVEIVKRITTPFGGINLEDISAPECFEIENRLIDELDIPVFHDDQHGTAIVALAALINALKVVNKKIDNCKIVILGAGAAGSSISSLLLKYGAKNIIMCDRHGAIYEGREDLQSGSYKFELAKVTNPHKEKGGIAEVMKGADVFVGVSGPGLIDKEMIKSMASDSIVFAMANPTPEIMPDDAKGAGAAVVGTGRSDFPNQINNVLAFPGIFRGLLDIGAQYVTEKMKVAAAEAIAGLVENPSTEKIIPGVFDDGIADAVAEAVKQNVS